MQTSSTRDVHDDKEDIITTSSSLSTSSRDNDAGVISTSLMQDELTGGRSNSNSIAATATSTTQAEPTDSNLRVEYHRLEELHRLKIARDQRDVDEYMQRERRFNVDYNRMSRNKLWSNVEGPECDGIYYDGTPDEYTQNMDVWPLGRRLEDLSIYQQLYDFFRFMWGHTKPYKTVFLILLRSASTPIQVAVLSWLTEYIQDNPVSTRGPCTLC